MRAVASSGPVPCSSSCICNASSSKRWASSKPLRAMLVYIAASVRRALHSDRQVLYSAQNRPTAFICSIRLPASCQVVLSAGSKHHNSCRTHMHRASETSQLSELCRPRKTCCSSLCIDAVPSRTTKMEYDFIRAQSLSVSSSKCSNLPTLVLRSIFGFAEFGCVFRISATFVADGELLDVSVGRLGCLLALTLHLLSADNMPTTLSPTHPVVTRIDLQT